MPTPVTQGAWRANLKVNGVLLEHLTPEMLMAQTPGGGYSVAQHLAHMTQVVNYWGWLRGGSFGDLPELYYDYNSDTQDFKAVTDLDRVREVMAQTYARALEVPDSPAPSDEAEEPPHASAVAYLMHMLISRRAPPRAGPLGAQNRRTPHPRRRRHVGAVAGGS